MYIASGSNGIAWRLAGFRLLPKASGLIPREMIRIWIAPFSDQSFPRLAKHLFFKPRPATAGHA
jgi:hypothetical protein